MDNKIGKKSSRLMVKNLPKHLKEPRFRTHFETCGYITDAKILMRNGKSRQFGFIGYKTIDEAEKAKEYFDKTYIDTSKISVDFSFNTNQYESIRKNSNKRKNKAYLKKDSNSNKKNKNRNKEDPEDAEFQKFLEVVRPKNDQYLDSPEEQIDETEINDLDEKKEENNKKTTQTDTKTSKAKKNTKKINPNERIFVVNIAYTATEEDIEKFFSQYGEIDEVHLVVDEIGHSKGFCFVSFDTVDEAKELLESKKKFIFQGRVLRISQAKEDPNKLKEENERSLTFKQQKGKEIKNEAIKEKRSWKGLFLRSETVTEAISNRTGKSKDKILRDDDRKKSLAVRVAINEAEIAKETKQYLVINGINEAIFFGDISEKKSRRAFFVKNVPFSTTEEDIRSFFEPFGSLERMLIPPSRAVVLIAFSKPNDAKKAFKKLANRKFKHVPIYLEWAPKNIFDWEKPVEKPMEIQEGNSQSESKNDQNEESKDSVKFSNSKVHPEFFKDTVGGKTRTVFIKNLNFETKESALKKLFSTIDGLISVTIKTKKSDDKEKLEQSMGYGFAEYKSPKSAENAIKELQGTKLDNHSLELSLSHRKPSEKSRQIAAQEMEAGAGRRTKLVVKNLPFEATAKELRTLLEEFGPVKSCRVPSKLRSHRGFGFVDFYSHSDAKRVLKELKDSHLYGRHLVLQWAKD